MSEHVKTKGGLVRNELKTNFVFSSFRTNGNWTYESMSLNH